MRVKLSLSIGICGYESVEREGSTHWCESSNNYSKGLSEVSAQKLLRTSI